MRTRKTLTSPVDAEVLRDASGGFYGSITPLPIFLIEYYRVYCSYQNFKACFAFSRLPEKRFIFRSPLRFLFRAIRTRKL